MFYFLHYLKDVSIVFNLFRYITFRSMAASVTAFFFCVLVGPEIISWLKKLKATAHQEREHAASIHPFFNHKKDVPTMGGVILMGGTLLAILLWANLSNRFVWLLFMVAVWFAGVGFLDDWLKLRSKSSKGLASRAKLFGQIFMGLAMGFYLYMDPNFDKWLYLPFLKKGAIYMGIVFIPFVILVLVGSSNALNLTDGLDGLAIGCTLFTTVTFAIISYLVGRVDFAAYLGIPYIAEAGEVAVVCSALVGASAGFLWFNSYPAEVMMGDTGSLSLGGLLGAVAILLKKEAVLVIVGGVFVWEALSVILQVASFKMTGRRIFRMSPYHHHLQLKGWPESKVTIRLWIVAMILAVIGLSTLKVM